MQREEYVSYLSLADYTAAIAGLNVPGDISTEDYFKELNAKGGVDGVKVKFIGVDTRYDVARGVSAYKRYRTEPKLLVANAIGTPIGKAVAPLATKEKIVQLVPGDEENFKLILVGSLLGAQPTRTLLLPPLTGSLQIGRKEKTGMPKLGFISWDSAYGKEPLRGGKEYAEKRGVTLAPPEFFPARNNGSYCLSQPIGKSRGKLYLCFVGGVGPRHRPM